MKLFFYSIVFASTVLLAGCFYHSTEVEHTVPATGGSTTTVINPPSGTTVTTAH